MIIGFLGRAVVTALLIVAVRVNARRLDAIIHQSAQRTAPDVRTFVTHSELAGDILEGECRPLPALRADPPVIHIPAAGPRPVYQIERQTARHPATVESGFILPVLQALGTAVALTLAVGILAWAAGWSWRIPAVVFALSLAGGWFWRLGLADRLLWAIESATRLDLDGDGMKGSPQPDLTFTLTNPARARADSERAAGVAEQDAQRAALLSFVDRCCTVGTSESAHGITASGPERDAYVKMRDVLMALGVAIWKSPSRPKSGWLMAVDRDTARQIVARHVL